MSESEEDGIDFENEDGAANQGKGKGRRKEKKNKKKTKKNMKCFRCGGPHQAKDCPEEAGSAPQEKSCYRCGGPHIARDCTEPEGKKGEGKKGEGKKGCFNCGGPHIARDCPDGEGVKKCFKCGGAHILRDCPQGEEGGKCFRCGGPHFARDCSLPDKRECYRCGGPHIARECREGIDQPAPHAPRHFGQAASSPAASFNRFATLTRLPSGELTEWEQDLRHQLVDILQYLNGPLPLVEWINHRIGGEVETFQDDTGAILVSLRSAQGNVRDFGPPAGGPPPRGPPPRDFPQDVSMKDDKRRNAFFEKLPKDSFNPSEIKLRNAIVEFLCIWKSRDKATLADLTNDDNIEKIRNSFIPRVVTQQEWIERRMGEEIVFVRDQRGNEIVELSRLGQEAVAEKLAEFATKRSAEHDINPQGGKRQRM